MGLLAAPFLTGVDPQAAVRVSAARCGQAPSERAAGLFAIAASLRRGERKRPQRPE